MDEYLALPDGAGRFPQDFSCPVVLRNPARVSCLTSTGLSPSMVPLSRTASSLTRDSCRRPYNPDVAETTSVWASSLSLAATQEITLVLFSSGY